MAKPPVHVTVTGAGGQIGYSILFRIASGQLLGEDQPIVLRLLEIEPAMKVLEGVVMELDDCAFPLLHDIVATSDLKTAFDGTSWALLVGSIPRKAGMERGDLLNVNGGIFKPQGRAIAANAASDVRILVVGNPCNTNCLIARSNAPEVPADRWFAMTRLDENRAKAQLAAKAGVQVGEVTNVAIWGNHSATQFPDFANARIGGKPATEVITDDRVAARRLHHDGAEARCRHHRRPRGRPRPPRPPPRPSTPWSASAPGRRSATCFSVAVASTGQYGAPEGLQFGFPVASDGKGGWSVVEGFAHDEFATDRIKVTTDELLAERNDVKELGLIS